MATRLTAISRVDPCDKGGRAPSSGSDSTNFGFGVPPAAGLPDPDHYPRNDNGNAKFFLALYGNNVRYVGNHPEGGGKWIVFNENTKRWVVDSKDVITRTLFREVEKRQLAFGRDLQELARLRNSNSAIPANLRSLSTRFPAQTFQPDALDKLAGVWIKWGTESGNSARVTNGLKQATYYDEVALDYEQLDSDPYLLPVANGLLRFHTKEERDAGKGPFEWIEDVGLCKEYLVTQNTNVPYIPFDEQEHHDDPEVRRSYRKFVDYIDKFLRSHMSDTVFDYTRRVLGISILGVNVKKAVFLYGRNDTGKSTLQNMMNEAMGDLAIGREPRIFLDTPFKGSLAEALPRRMCMVGELGAKEMDAGLFKAITGNDLVDCQLKNINRPVSMRARCTIISSCNSEPFIPEVDEATKSRFIVIPFRHQVTGKERDDKAQDDLMQHCKVSTLAWLVESCCDALEYGITDAPAELQMEASTFTSNMSDLSDFVSECLVRYDNTPEAKKYARNDQNDPRDPKPRWPNEMCTGHRTMYSAYNTYARENNMEKISSHMFTRKMKAAGFVQDGSRNGDNEIRWLGITLKGSDRVASS